MVNLARSTLLWIRKNWFLCLLVIALLAGTHFSEPIRRFSSKSLQELLVASVMFMMALGVPFQQLLRAVRNPLPAILATLISFFAIPIAGWFAFRFVFEPMGASALGAGLVVACCVPSTLASGAVWTRRAGGDESVAVLVTLITNIGGCFVIPGLLYLLLTTDASLSGPNRQLDIVERVFGLAKVVLFPIALAQVVLLVRALGTRLKRYKQPLSVACQTGILLMVLLSAAELGKFSSVTAVEFPILSIIIACIFSGLIHLAGMGLSLLLAKQFHFARPQRIAIAISGSQKTLMIGLKLAVDCGVSIIPMIAYHAIQLVLDTIIVDRFWNRDIPVVSSKRTGGRNDDSALKWQECGAANGNQDGDTASGNEDS